MFSMRFSNFTIAIPSHKSSWVCISIIASLETFLRRFLRHVIVDDDTIICIVVCKAIVGVVACLRRHVVAVVAENRLDATGYRRSAQPCIIEADVFSGCSRMSQPKRRKRRTKKCQGRGALHALGADLNLHR